MVIYLQFIQIVFMIALFFVIHILLDKKIPEYCKVKSRGNNTSDLQKASNAEKLRMKLFMFIPSTIITGFTLLFFYITTFWCLQREPSLFYIVEISSIILGASGTFFIAYPTLKTVVTYWDTINSNSRDLKDKILEDKGVLINAGFGLILVFYSFVIKLIYLLPEL